MQISRILSGVANEVANVRPPVQVVLDWFKITGPILSTFGVISFICSGMVVFTAIKWYDTLTKNKIYMKLIAMVSFCDMMASIGSILGYPDNMDICAVQGFFIMFFYRASWFWASSISFTLYSHVKNGRLSVSFLQLSCIIWGTSIMIELSPIIFGGLTYGNCYRFAPELQIATTFGTLAADGSGTEAITKFKHWMGVCFVMPLVLSLAFMLICYSYIALKIKPGLKLASMYLINIIK